MLYFRQSHRLIFKILFIRPSSLIINSVGNIFLKTEANCYPAPSFLSREEIFYIFSEPSEIVSTSAMSAPGNVQFHLLIAWGRVIVIWLMCSPSTDRYKSKNIFVVQPLSCVWLCNHMDCSTRLPCPSVSPAVCSNSCLLNRWCHPTVSSSVTIIRANKENSYHLLNTFNIPVPC